MLFTGVSKATLADAYGLVNAIAFSPDCRMLALAASPPEPTSCSMVYVWTIEPATTTVKLKEKHLVDRSVENLSFSEVGGYIKTNMGYIPLSGYHEPIPNQDLSYHVYIENDWIFRDEQRLLWIPPDYRARCKASYNNIYVLGHFSGRVTFIGFNFPVTQTYNESPLHELR